MRRPTNVPLRRAPSRMRSGAGWRLRVTKTSSRSSTSRTGRPALRASAATIGSSRQNVLAPKLPPIGGTDHAHVERVEAEHAGELRAHVERRLGAGPHRQPPSAHSAVQACGSIGACCAPAQVHSPSTTTSASSRPASPRPWSRRKRWQALLCRRRGAGRSRAPGRPSVVHQRRALGERVLRLVDAGQLVVLHQDELGRGARRRSSRRRRRPTGSPTCRTAPCGSTSWSRMMQP